ncbi:DUF4012 domain-containing protein, partial [Motilibacter deserti]|nr:DUF4012 domain-containing protein [Motilibacter deserti]
MTLRHDPRAATPEPPPAQIQDSDAETVVWQHPLDRLEVVEETRTPRWRRVLVWQRWSRWPRWRKPVLWALGALVVAGALGAAGAWMALGLVQSARDIQDSATGAQDELEAFRTQLTAGDRAGAVAHLDAAAAHLSVAHDAADRPQVRIAGYLPVAATAVDDLDHLLTAADETVEAGRTGIDVIGALSGGTGPKVYTDGKFSVPVIRDTTARAEEISRLMLSAERELLKVKGTAPKTERVLEAKETALEQVRELRTQMEAALPVLRTLPAMVGADSPKNYLVAILNPAEMRASGGAPLTVATIGLDNGELKIPAPSATGDIDWPNALDKAAGDTSTVGVNPPIPWKPVDGDPFTPAMQAKGTEGISFVNSNVNPDFRAAGENMARAWEGGTGNTVDGVIALDIVA